METTLYAVIFNDGRIYRINCRRKNQKQRFKIHTEKLKEQIKEVMEITNVSNLSVFVFRMLFLRIVEVWIGLITQTW